MDLKTNKRLTGTAYEKRAGEYLKNAGLEILEYNFRSRNGEIDIIAREKSVENGKEKYTTIFIEVKYRRSTKSGYPAEAVSLNKQKTICRVADYYRTFKQKNKSAAESYRFDVVAILGDEITWYKNAFSYVR